MSEEAGWFTWNFKIRECSDTCSVRLINQSRINASTMPNGNDVR